jgi:hypothetical protein
MTILAGRGQAIPIRVDGERLGVVLESLERAGQLRRTLAGWQRVD